MKVNECKGSVKAYRSNSKLGTHEYTVILFRGTEDDLIEKLDGEISNLITFCDNGFKFEDKIQHHYGGYVTKVWATEKETLGQKHYSLCQCKDKPSPNSLVAFKVGVYYD